jgi:hypothetical protein
MQVCMFAALRGGRVHTHQPGQFIEHRRVAARYPSVDVPDWQRLALR